MKYLVIVDTAYPAVFEDLSTVFAEHAHILVMRDRRCEPAHHRTRTIKNRRVHKPAASWIDLHFTVIMEMDA